MPAAGRRKPLYAAAALLVAAAIGLGGGYLLWGWPTDWYHARDAATLPPGPDNDLIRYGQEIVVNTSALIGPAAATPEMRFAGNHLACTNCHLNAGLQAFAAPFVSTLATFPMMVSDVAQDLSDRLNDCLTNSLNGKPMPPESREMQALIAYIGYVGRGSPQGVRVPGMGLLPQAAPAEVPSAARGATVYADVCAKCHGADGLGQRKPEAAAGYTIPPLWGDDSFNAAAGMADIRMASAFIRANMPRGTTYQQMFLTDQQAWDVAAYVTAQPRPPRPAPASP